MPAVATPGHVTVTDAVLKTAIETAKRSGVGPWIEAMLTDPRRGPGGHYRVIRSRRSASGPSSSR